MKFWNKNLIKIKVNNNINEIKDLKVTFKDKKFENLSEIKIHKDPTVNSMLMDWVNKKK